MIDSNWLVKRASPVLAAVLAAPLLFAAAPAQAEKITLKIASGHSPSWHFIQLTQTFFIPEVKKRVKEKTGHDIEFIEGFSGAMAKTTEVLEAVESGVVDVGMYCICHEAQKLALNNFPMYLPFGPSNPEVSVKATRKVYDTNPELNKQFEKYGQRVLALVPFAQPNDSSGRCHGAQGRRSRPECVLGRKRRRAAGVGCRTGHVHLAANRVDRFDDYLFGRDGFAQAV